ncbi:uncharacterized protein E5676_scaffold313G002240 [Cucumis melo var. makuwa]|uniref:Reverse transcriptase/retrotransposon-derived protein RNase H-like domain-containing protein n=1 Tax=Cucumis melo var. makuwa TaxID=1194695 RepID=A0A5D3DSQ6_CUCMM|nr:uncharacterized protein E6C27_scaffold154G001600 [Cucumis melo var. makuwa]TYK26594.1 uncharacterized protein E5676_scaffold313G002240 [Cucumis melo var. makuwa]
MDLVKIDVIHQRIFPNRQTTEKRIERKSTYIFDEKCHQAFQTLKDMLTPTSILITPDWLQPFELMCDTSDVTVGAILGQKKDKVIHPIYYAGYK